jgi:transposase-like protein
MEKTSTSLAGEPNEWRESLEAAIRERVRDLIEEILEEEVEEGLGTGRSERRAERHGYRHGVKTRKLATRSGQVELKVPRGRLIDREGQEREWQSELVPRYRRSTPEVEEAVIGVYLSGGNTRRIKNAVGPLLRGAPLSRSSVSRLVARIEGVYQEWAKRDLGQEDVVLLYLDAIYPLLRNASRVIKQPVVMALGVRADGDKVLLGMMTVGSESTDAWQLLLSDLAGRGLKRPELIIGDGNKGLKAAAARVWGTVRHQRCTIHKLRNLQAKAPKHCLEELGEDYRAIVYAASRAEAEQARERFLGKWRKQCPSVAASLEEAGDELLTFWRFPVELHDSLRTTNIIERINQEFRRRVKTQGPLPSEGAVLRLFFGLLLSGNLNMRKVRGYRHLSALAQVA